MDILLIAHNQKTKEHMAVHPVVLCVQDTSELDYTAHPDTKDLGTIANHQKGSLGLLMQDTVVFDPSGTPLGLVDVQCWVRPPDPPKRGTGEESPEEKE